MIINDLLNLISKKKRKKDGVITAQKLATGMGILSALGVVTGILFAPKAGKETRKDLKKRAVNSIGKIKHTVKKKADTAKDFTEDVVQEVYMDIKDINEKAENVKEDIKDGYDEIAQDIEKTAKNISNEIKKSLK